MTERCGQRNDSLDTESTTVKFELKQYVIVVQAMTGDEVIGRIASEPIGEFDLQARLNTIMEIWCPSLKVGKSPKVPMVEHYECNDCGGPDRMPCRLTTELAIFPVFCPFLKFYFLSKGDWKKVDK